MQTKQHNILIVEDEGIVARDIENSLKNLGYLIAGIISSGEAAINAVEKVNPDLILMDIVLQGKMDGIEAAGLIHNKFNIPIIYLTAYADDAMLQRAKITEPFGYIIKPFDDMELHFAIEMALYKHSMQEKFIEQNKLLTNVIESLTHPFIVIDANNYTVMIANRAAANHIKEDISTCHVLTRGSPVPCHDEAFSCPLDTIKETKQPYTVEHVLQDKQGKQRTVELHFYPIFDSSGEVTQVIEYSFDITDRKDLEKQFLAAQRMDSVGRLAGGIAHDFNNIMSAVLGYAEMTMMDVDEDSPAMEGLKTILDAGEKAASLTRQLLAFSSNQVLQIQAVDLNATVENMVKMLSRMIGEDITLTLKTDKSIRSVMADPSQIEQVLLNLVVNARDAMPSGGSLKIKTQDITITDSNSNIEDIKPGTYVLMSVADSGEGIEKKVLDKIFEPFFTTKQKGKGTGLGLATVFGIVRQHNGHIHVDSELGKGSTFSIYFPAAEETVSARHTRTLSEMPRGTESLLVVDDEPLIRKLITDTLSPLGYQIIEAAHPAEAIKKADDINGAVDLLITDIIMPDMNGKALAGVILKKWPHIKTLYMSGYADTEIVKTGLKPGANYIQKPLRPQVLALMVRALLDNTAAKTDMRST